MTFDDLNPEQQQAFNTLLPILSGKQGGVATLEGFAGTGKTTTTAAIVRHLLDAGLTVMVTAPTNKAVGVLEGKIGAGPDYRTIHAALGYKLVNQQDGTGKLVQHRAPSVADFDVVIVDESSMLGDDLFAPTLAAARTYYTSVLFVGDPAQLLPVTPGVKARISPAFTDKVPTRVRLSKIVRQAEENPVLRWSVMLRESIERGEAPDISAMAADLRRGDERLCQIIRADDALIQDWAADAHRRGHDMRVLAYTNQAVVRHNRAVHDMLFPGGRPYEPGEPLVASDGDIRLDRGPYSPSLRLQNGSLVDIVDVEDESCTVEGFGAMRVRLRTDGGGEGSANLAVHPDAVRAEISARFGRVRLLKAEGKEAEAGNMSRSAYALKSNLPDLRHAYAMTVHKSQGSTFSTVIVDWRDAAYSTRMDPGEVSRLLYVAITRPTTHCVIVI